MASTTSLLKTQRSRQQSIWNAEDQQLDYEWSLSDKSPEALNFYIGHYQARINNPQAEAKNQLTYQKRITSAQKAYTSNEIQRATIEILEGRQSEQFKINTLEGLYTRAFQNGDYDLAQSLRIQLDNAYIKQQTAAGGYGSGGGGGGSAASEFKTAVNAFIADVKSGDAPLFADSPLTANRISDLITTLGEAGAAKLLVEAGLPEGTSPLELLYNGVSNQIATLNEQIANAPDEATRADLQNKLADLTNKQKWDIAGAKMTTAQLAQAIEGARTGNPMYDFVVGENGEYIAKARKTTNVEWGQDAQGNTILVPQRGTSSGEKSFYDYAEGQNLRYEIDKDGNVKVVAADKASDSNKKQLSQEDILARAGLRKGNGVYEITDPRISAILGGDTVISENAVFFDDITGLPRFMNADGTVTGFDQNLVPYKEQGLNVSDFVSRGGGTAASTTDVLGTKQLRDLQTNVRGASFQPALPGSFYQAAGTSGILQQAATAKQLNEMKVENLRVQELQRQQALRVQSLPKAPTISVSPYNIREVVPIRVTNPVAPKLTVSATQPSRLTGGLQSAGGQRLQGGSGSLQGGAGINYFQGGNLRVQ